MDQPCSYRDLSTCLRHLSWVNRFTFAHRPILRWLDQYANAVPRQAHPLRIVDVGCGYGDLLRRVARWAARRKIAVTLTGIDLNPHAVRAATAATPAGTGIRWLQGDAFSCTPSEGTDIILTSLVTHHLEDAEIVRFLAWMEQTARRGWFVLDLHRKPIPYYAFSVLMKPWPFHPFIRPDGLVSIRRSFRHEDWQRLCRSAGLALTDVDIHTHRPARLCVSHSKW